MGCLLGSAWKGGKPGPYSLTGSFTGLGRSYSKIVGLAKVLSTSNGNMIYVGSSNDFEMYSSTSKGAIQGYGYVFHAGK